ncbi:TonB-dependent receptor [Ideonella sp. DXS22W]|uniref:TonB-dependent receptor n=1 Tax=Pseudaquabacterium inlustre TaxID=2984192 RepID=A0ABU9CEX0_9BURK
MIPSFRHAPVALACLLTAASAAAQNSGTSAAAAPASAAVTETVVITGTPKAQRLLDAPFAISAVDATALRDAGPMVNLSEALAAVPGLVVNNRSNYAQDLQMSSRGFGARAAFGVRGLRLYTDGIPATMPDGQGQVAHVDLAGAERIEVLRGPFSALYGSSSGGVVAVFSAPVRGAQGELALDAGSFGLRQARASVAAPLGQGFDARVSVSSTDLDGFRPHSAAHRTLGNLRLGWRNDTDTVVLLVSDHNQRAQDPLGLKREQFDADARSTTAEADQFDTRKTIRQTQAGLSWRHRFTDAGALRESQLAGYYGSRGVTGWQAITAATQTGSARQSGGVVDFDRTYGGLEGRLLWQIGALDLVTGLNVETQQDDRRGYENFSGTASAPGTYGVVGKVRRDETNRATTTEGFVQAQWPLAAGVALTGGLRGGRVELSTHDRYQSCADRTRVDSVATCTSQTGVNGDDSGALSYSYVNPALGLRWSLAPTWTVYASAARGFESPTLTELAYRPDGAGGFNGDLKGQRSQQLELGTKWRGGGIEAEFALFDARTSDEIGVFTNSGGRSTFRNVGRTHRSGAELSAAWRPVSGLRLQATVSVLDATYLDSFETCTAAPCTLTSATNKVTVSAGNRIAGTQRASAYAQAAWRAGWLPGELALEWRALSRAMANDTNTASAGGYALANLRWSGTLPLGAADAIELLARVDNVFDRVHAGSVIVNDANQRFFETGVPRALLLSARWQHRW